jgi:uncharacterized protein with FMN-binding domain
VGILIVGWQAGAGIATQAAGTSTAGTSAQTNTGTGATGGTATSGATAAPSSGTTGSTTGAKDGTYTGSSVSTRFGTVQVRVTVSGGKITDVTPLQLTDAGGRSVQISNYAAPILRTEVLAAQSAKVNSVSGATYTSTGYLTSLQSALDQANL